MNRWGYPCSITSPPERPITRGFLLAAGVAIATLIACAAMAAGSGQHSSCPPPHAHTIAKDEDVRVYSLTGKIPTRGGTYACLLRSGKIVTLTKPGLRRPPSIEHITFAGAIIAYTDSSHGVDTGSTDIMVLDIASGRTLLTVPRAGDFIDGCYMGFHDVTDLVVTRRGSVAWLVREGAECKTTTVAAYSAQAGSAAHPGADPRTPSAGAFRTPSVGAEPGPR